MWEKRKCNAFVRSDRWTRHAVTLHSGRLSSASRRRSRRGSFDYIPLVDVGGSGDDDGKRVGVIITHAPYSLARSASAPRNCLTNILTVRRPASSAHGDASRLLLSPMAPTTLVPVCSRAIPHGPLKPPPTSREKAAAAAAVASDAPLERCAFKLRHIAESGQSIESERVFVRECFLFC